MLPGAAACACAGAAGQLPGCRGQGEAGRHLPEAAQHSLAASPLEIHQVHAHRYII